MWHLKNSSEEGKTNVIFLLQSCDSQVWKIKFSIGSSECKQLNKAANLKMTIEK